GGPLPSGAAGLQTRRPLSLAAPSRRLRSLRELQIRLAEDSRLTRLISMRGISHSHLPKLLHDRPADLWAPLIAELIHRLSPTDAPSKAWAIDATTLTLGAKLLARITGRDLERPSASVRPSLCPQRPPADRTPT
ncbi:MAG: hypothetical protein ACP5KN_16270, partial [Armatimonadota bacterium]